MSVSVLPVSTQNYLKVIWGRQEWTDAPVATSEIAARMGLTTPTVSEGIRRLGEQGLVEHPRYGRVALTAEGRGYALAMVRRHRLLETFLVEVLHYGWDEVHDEAEQLEHAVSDLLIDRVDALLGHPRRDPHGDPIPTADGRIERPPAEPLSGISAGTVVVERISDEDPALLQFLADHGIRVGSRLTLGPAAPFSDAVEVRAEGADAGVALGRSARDAVWVSREE
ncbi:MAG: metal-dependent transcriptional regulator [Micrococcales bacterium]|nr:metal-dependent transcriptional regulator [Micrococcales bacterium]